MEKNDWKTIIKEYHVKWIFNRCLYGLKLKMLRMIPQTERIFEKRVNIKRIFPLCYPVKEIENFLKQLPEIEKEKVITEADFAAVGKIKGFSSVMLDYGNPIQWNYNPITKCTINFRKKWYMIPDFHPDQGDIKVVWEASRLTHFYLFIRAYILTKDEKYYRAFSNQLADWLEKNLYSYGPNYKCGQECSLRMINALITYSFFKIYNLTSTEDEKNIKTLIQRCYQKILSNFFYAHKCIRNNHTLSELCGMIVGAWCCEDNKKLKKAYQWMDKELEWQFLNDGGYRQYSYTYQRLALQLMEFLSKIETITNIHISDTNKKKIMKSAEMLYQLQNNQGDVPNYGPNDGALIFPVHSCSYRDFRPVVDGVLKCIGGESIYPPGMYEEEALWFCKIDKNWEKTNLPKRSVNYPDAGCYMMRDSDMMAILYAPSFDSRPAQMDVLHLDLWVKEKNIFCDSGTLSYADLEGQQFVLTEAHNTIKVYGKEQMKKQGVFFLYQWPACKVKKCDAGEFDAEMESFCNYTHRRKVVYKKKRMVIRDLVKSDVPYSLIFHTPCTVREEEKTIKLFDSENMLAQIFIEADMQIEVRPCYRSLFYLQKEAINEIIIKKETKGEAITKIVIA